MNEPHVVWLLYQVKHDISFDYSGNEPLEHEEAKIRLRVVDAKACFTMKEHCATASEAQKVVESFIDDWECTAAMEYGPNRFNLEFLKSHIEDRNPEPPLSGAVSCTAALPGGLLGSIESVANLSEVSVPYPSLPSSPIAPDAKSMLVRYIGYRQDREKLPGMAYFCLTVLEWLAAEQEPSSRRGSSSKRREAARKFGIDECVPNRIGSLSVRGREGEARKREKENYQAFSADERRFLEESVKVMIRRVSEANNPSAGGLTKIRLSDLP